jgi:XTP/dITP diphosphohydrolase
MSERHHRRFSDGRIVVASHNKGKVREIEALLTPFDVRVISALDLDLPEPEETGSTFTDNAILKATSAAHQSDLPALADDSGLCVSGLDGAPGIYSARWAGPTRDFMVAMRRVHQKLSGREPADRRAYFVCCLSLAWPDGHIETFEGRVDGELIWPPRGDKGFGYDPMFVPEGEDKAFGEMDPDMKHAMSHRARAFKQLADACFANN